MKFYEVRGEERKEIAFDLLNKKKLAVGIMKSDEFLRIYEKLGIREISVQNCMSGEENRNMVFNAGEYVYGIVNAVKCENIFSLKYKVMFFIVRNMFLIVTAGDDVESVSDLFNATAFGKRRNGETDLGKLSAGFFESLLDGHREHIESIAEHSTALEESLINDKVSADFNRRVFSMKKELLAFDSYYNQLINAAEELRENESGLFGEDASRYFEMFSNKAARLHNLVNNISNRLVHLSDAYQAYLDYSINKTMKVFTVVTSIFLPLTLITGWYGMNFINMPETRLEWGYYALAAVCAVLVTVFLILFKRKKYI